MRSLKQRYPNCCWHKVSSGNICRTSSFLKKFQQVLAGMSSAENKASTYMNLSPYSLLVNIFQAHNSPIVQIVQASARQVHHIHNLMVQYVSLIAVTVNSSLWGCIVLHYVKSSLHLQAGNFSYIANIHFT